MGYGNKLRILKLEYFDGTIKTVRYTAKNYWAAVGNKSIKTYAVTN